ncbi:MAG: hypothetical protein R3F55_04900 [Alphaproteobacteria bacterium]
MIARLRLALVAAAAGFGLAGCDSPPQLGVLTPYGEGYSDGCDSGYADLGLEAFDYQRGGVLGGVFGGDYGAGWEKGYSDCQAFMRAAAL